MADMRKRLGLFLAKNTDHNILWLRMALLFAYVAVACLFVLLVRPWYIVSILIVLGPPTVANFLWLRRTRKKVFVFSIVSAAIFAPPIELAARLANVWDVQSVFPRPFGLIPIENMLFAFINFFWVLSFYEYFVDGDTEHKVSRRFRVLTLLYCLMAITIYTLFVTNPDIVGMNYFALAVPIVIAPAAIIFWKKPEWLRKTVVPTLFFTGVFFIYEMVSLHIGSWWWPGDYAAPLIINGRVFPLDDVIIWYLLSTPALVGGYEFFADDWE